MWLTCPRRAYGEIATPGIRKPVMPKFSSRFELARSSGTRRGRDVVEEASPLVVVDEHRARPELRRGDEGVDDVGHEGLADADVAVRMLVAREAVATAAVEEHRVDEGEVREVPGRGVGVELARPA